MIKPDKEYYIVNSFFKLTKKGYELVIDSYGNKYYFLDGLHHRENAPAIIYPNSYKAWFIHGKYHRLSRLRLGLKSMAQP